MARTSCASLAIATAAITWSLLMVARADLPVISEGTQGNLYPNFPYCRCVRSGAYSLAPHVTFKGNGTYCFTLLVRNCTARCCRVNLRKIEFDVKPQCAVRAASIRTTLNGVPTRVGPNIYFPKDGPVGSAVLRLTDLPLGLSDNGTEVCITLRAAPSGAGCSTLEQLCVPPFGSPPGVCRAALFNSNNSTDSCCPQSDSGSPKPPPPLRPPSTPPPPPPCPLCLTVRLVPPLLDFPPFRLDAALCTQIQTSLSARLNAALASAVASNSIQSPLVSYSPDPSKCTPLEATVCGTLASAADGAAVQSLLQATTDLFVTELSTGVCSATTGSYAIRLASEPDACVSINSGFDCDVPPDPFPFCRCNKTKAITPLYVVPTGTEQPGRTPGTTLYCFTIAAVPEAFLVPSSCGSNLSKVEIWADDTRRRNITGIRVTPAGGLPTYKSIVWGAKGENSLRVTPLNWSFLEANGGEVCIELFNTVALEDFCIGDALCFLSLFDDRKGCCPVYGSFTEPITIPA